MRGKLSWKKVEEWSLILIGITLPLSIALANMALALSLLVLCVAIVKDPKRGRFLLGGITIPLLIHLLVDFTSIFGSGFPRHISDWFEDKWVLMAYFAGLGMSVHSVALARALKALVISGSVMAIYCIIQFTTGFDLLRGTELESVGVGYMAVGVFTNHLTYAGMALVVFLIAISRVTICLPTIPNLKLWISAALTGLGLFVSCGRSAIIGAMAGLFMVVMRLSGRIRIYLFGAIVSGIAVLTVLLPGMADRFGRIISGGVHSEGPRIRLWQSSLEMVKHHPWFGVGQSNFGTAFEIYGLPGEYPSTAHPHCDLLSIAVDGGIFSLLTFILVLYVFFMKAFSFAKEPLGDLSRRWILSAGPTVVIGLLVAGLFQNYLTDAEVSNMFWFVIGITMNLERTLRVKQI